VYVSSHTDSTIRLPKSLWEAVNDHIVRDGSNSLTATRFVEQAIRDELQRDELPVSPSAEPDTDSRERCVIDLNPVLGSVLRMHLESEPLSPDLFGEAAVRNALQGGNPRSNPGQTSVSESQWTFDNYE
jgi:hypothetical protein